MPTIYLSPSTQDFNPYVIGGNEELYMNLVVDAMIPYLREYGIDFDRNTPDMTAGSSINASNAGTYDFHVAVHSNASGPGNEGRNRGTVVFYYPGNPRGLRMAEIMAENFQEISPTPNLVRTFPTTSLGEVSRTKAPAVLIEVAYHDNVEDANWIVDNIDLIGETLARSIAEYFEAVPDFTSEVPSQSTGRVTLSSGYLNIRSAPSTSSSIIGMIPNGSVVQILNSVGDWYYINYNGTIGYVAGQYIALQ